MQPGGLSERDRWIVGACLGAALVVAVGLPLFGNPILLEGRRVEVATWASLVLPLVLLTLTGALAGVAAARARAPQSGSGCRTPRS